MKRLMLWVLAMCVSLMGCAGTVTPSPTPEPTPSMEPTPTPAQSLLPTVEGQADITIFAMDTVMVLQVYGENAQENLDLIVQEINRLERDLSVTRETSDIWAINHSEGAPVTVGEDAATLLELAQTLGDQTGGALDVTMYPVVKAWGFTTSDYRIPDQRERKSLLERVGYQKIETAPIDGSTGLTVTLPQGMELDLGAIAKGYAGEKAADLLRANGVTSALLNMGGNVQTVGAKTDGSYWRIGIQDPNGGSGAYLGVVQMKDQAAVTSGGYERYFEADGVRYWHIMDPATGAPARSGVVSATIVAHDGGLCDGLSTSLFILGVDGALDYWRTYGGFDVILVDEDNNVWVTGGLKDRFTLVGTQYTLRIVEE